MTIVIEGPDCSLSTGNYAFKTLTTSTHTVIRGGSLTLNYPMTRKDDTSGVSWSDHCGTDVTLTLIFTLDPSVNFVT